MVIQLQSKSFEPDFIAFLRAQAESDACAVSDYLREHKVQSPNPDGSWQKCALPACWLIAFAIILRLRHWELHHIRLHLDAGIPSAEETRIKFVALLTDIVAFEQFSIQLSSQIASLYYSSFLWRADAADQGQTVQIAVITKEDSDFLDALADFLLKARPA